MSVSNDSVTNLLRSEKRSLAYFLTLYTTFTLLILVLSGWMYFRFEQELMLEQKRIRLQELANELIIQLKAIHTDFEPGIAYPRDIRFKSAIYDWDKVQIFSLIDAQAIELDKAIYKSGQHIHFIQRPEAFYLGAKYVLLEIPDDELWLDRTFNNIFTYGTLFFVMMLMVGYFLMRLFLRPMRDSILLLDNFIKDTTHELNTPITAILTNVESIKRNLQDEKLRRKLERIEIGARTVSNLYQDLTYLVLNHKIISQDEALQLDALLQERIHYFTTIARQKRITITDDLYPATLYADRKKITKLIDNLLSNAIKYNKVEGSIHIVLGERQLIIRDTGIGIPKDKLDSVFERYSRFNSSAGGFGIGLNIVAMIAREYKLDIRYSSEEKEGTTVEVTW